MSSTTFDPLASRAQFPALNQDHQVYFDNAGGSQVVGSVATAVKDYLEETNVQLGASYDVAKQSTEIHARGLQAAASFMSAEKNEVVIGPSTTQLFSNLSLILNLPPSSEIILSALDHEGNIAPWLRLAALQSHTVKWWPSDPSSHPSLSPAETNPTLTPLNLRPLLSEKTKLVCCTHASNVLGNIHDIAAIAREVHTVPGAKLCVDGVALAPHREIDVKALGVDVYAFSWYKVYGPHNAILYASTAAQHSWSSLAHYFHPGTDLTTRLGLAAASYELLAAIPAVVNYFGPDRSKTWDAIAVHEEQLAEILLAYLRSRSDTTIFGERTAERAKRVPVISFVVQGKGSREVVEAVEEKSRFGLRWGSFYSKRLVEGVLGPGLGEEGVVRVSLVHYNTREEVEAFVRVLGGVLGD